MRFCLAEIYIGTIWELISRAPGKFVSSCSIQQYYALLGRRTKDIGNVYLRVTESQVIHRTCFPIIWTHKGVTQEVTSIKQPASIKKRQVEFVVFGFDAEVGREVEREPF